MCLDPRLNTHRLQCLYECDDVLRRAQEAPAKRAKDEIGERASLKNSRERRLEKDRKKEELDFVEGCPDKEATVVLKVLLVCVVGWMADHFWKRFPSK